MIKDLSKFMIIWLLIMFMFVCVASLTFGELDAFEDFFTVTMNFFESSLANWSLSTYDGKLAG